LELRQVAGVLLLAHDHLVAVERQEHRRDDVRQQSSPSIRGMRDAPALRPTIAPAHVRCSSASQLFAARRAGRLRRSCSGFRSRRRTRGRRRRRAPVAAVPRRRDPNAPPPKYGMNRNGGAVPRAHVASICMNSPPGPWMSDGRRIVQSSRCRGRTARRGIWSCDNR
jgi:hypothetical protein